MVSLGKYTFFENWEILQIIKKKMVLEVKIPHLPLETLNSVSYKNSYFFIVGNPLIFIRKGKSENYLGYLKQFHVICLMSSETKLTDFILHSS